MAYTAWPPDSPTSQKWLPEMFAKTKEKQYSKYPLLLTIKDIETGSRMAGNSFVRNVIYYSGKNALLYRIYNDIDLSTTVSDYNTIFHAQLPLLIPFTSIRQPAMDNMAEHGIGSTQLDRRSAFCKY